MKITAVPPHFYFLHVLWNSRQRVHGIRRLFLRRYQKIKSTDMRSETVKQHPLDPVERCATVVWSGSMTVPYKERQLCSVYRPKIYFAAQRKKQQ
jgi:hypothetical protein